NAEDTPRMFQTPIPARPARAPISLLPYGYAGFDFDSGKTLLNSGLDAKTQLGSSLTLIGTILPDFRNIENEVLSLDFSYFERLAGESRPFFQEGAGFLRVGGGGRRLFASQRIAEFDYGLNAYGSLDDRTSGSLLAAVNQGDELNLVASAERQLNGSASLSAAYVGRIARGRNNHAARVQSSTRFGDWSAYGNLNMTQDQTQGTALAGAAGLDYGGVGSRFGLDYTEVEAGFNPALGFWSERDFRRVNMGYNWERPQPGGVLLETEVGASVDFAERRNGDRYSKGFEVEGSLTFRNLADLDVSYEQGAFEDDRNHLARVNLEWPRGNPYRRWFVDYRRGSLAGRTFTAHQVGWSIRPWRRVQTGVSAQWVDHFEESRQTIFSANWDRGLYESIGGRLIERNGDINWHLSWRRSGGLGAEYFVIFGDPNARTFRPQLILKAVVPFELRF
ncbi:MAG: DUF5916 domain-containing protein, partial [Fimbriimonadaceae bacterium]|nr:DUF5916 domain-containing protein [Fimbriimonadaceae bacterium]